ncbi:MAG: hypothetical protein KA144_09820 [Xanthomonadaceae bacterium]|nr:hypothetical protein [Xanthomonadaceae bacterium]
MRSFSRLAPVALCAFALFVGHASAGARQGVANGLDAAAKAKLVGKHRLTLQWIGWSDLSVAGKLKIEERNGVLRAEGEQTGRGENEGDLLRVSGKIVSASQDGFVFEGEIVTRVSHIAGGAECKREGRFAFKTKGGRKYWRLQEMDNPCDQATDYVDIYFRGI